MDKKQLNYCLYFEVFVLFDGINVNYICKLRSGMGYTKNII